MMIEKGDICCTLTEEEVRNDFAKLASLRADQLVDRRDTWEIRSGAPTPGKLDILFRGIRTGQKLAQYHHWRHRVRTPTFWMQSGQSILEKWKANETTFLVGAMERVGRCDKKVTDERKLRYNVVRCNSALMTLTHFRASVSKYFSDRTGARDVLDFSAGWGDRLTGFLASESVRSITLVDPRPGSIQCCRRQHEHVRSSKTLVTHQDGAEKVLPLLSDGSVDLVLTSPPYFNLEKYGETEEESVGQIHRTVDTVEGYLSRFLSPVLRHSCRVLRPGGMLVVNIDDNAKANVVICQSFLDIMQSLSEEMTFVGTAALRKSGGFGQFLHTVTRDKAEPIYIYQKVGGNFPPFDP